MTHILASRPMPAVEGSIRQATQQASEDEPAVRVTRRECWYFSRRIQLTRRGYDLEEAGERAVRLANYIERRCRRIGK